MPWDQFFMKGGLKILSNKQIPLSLPGWAQLQSTHSLSHTAILQLGGGPDPTCEIALIIISAVLFLLHIAESGRMQLKQISLWYVCP